MSGNRGVGRPKGSQNALTRTVKETFEHVFNTLQSDSQHGGKGYRLKEWAMANPTEFYRLAARLIPTKVDASVEALVVNLITGVPPPLPPAIEDHSDIA